MRNFFLILSLLLVPTFISCAVCESTPTTTSATAPGHSISVATAPYIPPYTDDQTQDFAAKLPTLKYPTEIGPACKTLGIDPAHLYSNGAMLGESSGMSGSFFTQLSPHYWIWFQFHTEPKYSGIINVIIAKPKSK